MALADIWALRREVYRKDIFEARDNLDDARKCIAAYINLSQGHNFFGFDKFSSFIDEFLWCEMRLSLQNNDSFMGIIEVGLRLLNVVATFEFFENEVINITRKELLNILQSLALRQMHLGDHDHRR